MTSPSSASPTDLSARIQVRINPWIKLHLKTLAEIHGLSLEHYLGQLFSDHVKAHIPDLLAALEGPASDLT